MPYRLRLAFLIVIPFAVAAAAQQSAPPLQSGYVFQANVGEVLVQADVLDRHGRSVTNLPASDFTVYENGVKQAVESFSHDDAPVSVGILVDNSGSMESKRVQVDQAALNFVRASNPQDEVFIVKFNDIYRMVAPFTNSIPTLEQGLGRIDPEAGTALYDALIHATDYMHRNARRPKKVLLLITDGVDDSSSHSLEQTLQIIQAQNAPEIYCIGLLDKSDGSSMVREAKRILIQIAEDTGGVAYFPKNLDQVDGVTRAVAHDIRLQYSFVYHSNQTGTGYRSIRLEVNDPHQHNLTAHTRRGYYPGAGQ